MKKANEITKSSRRNLSAKEKHDYCVTFEKSTSTLVEFCKENGFSRSAFRIWYKDFKESRVDKSNFSPLCIASESTTQEDKIEFAIRLSNQIEFCISMDKPTLISFIQELSHATAIIR